MLRIAFNGFLFSQRPTGVMRYAREILQEIDKICASDEFTLVVPQYTENVPKLKNIQVVKYGTMRGNIWEQIDFYKYLRKTKSESVNFNNTMPILKPGMIVIHDIAYKIHPDFASSMHGRISNLYHRIIFYVASKSKMPIITVSHFSKQQIIDEYKVNPNRISVISNAWQHFERFDADKSILKDLGIVEKQYYFSLGSLSKMKNTKWIIDVAKKYPDRIFVLSGARPKNSNLEFEGVDNVLFAGFASDEQVKALIQNCAAFIYPSTYDGFGIPPMEALSQHAKIICSNAACLPEIYGNSVHYIDPYSTDVELDKLLDEYVDCPEAVLNKYSWKKSAHKFYDVLKNYRGN